MNASTLSYSRIHIIESLRPRDTKTGERLFKEIQGLSNHFGRVQPLALSRCQSAAEFLSELETVRKEAEAGAKHILHIEAHGDSTGLELTNGDFLPWESLFPVFSSINRASRFNLTLAMSACFGATFAVTTRLEAPSATRAILGPTDDTTDVEIERAFGAFYSAVLVHVDGERAIKAFLHTEKKCPYYFAGAETLFRDGFALLAEQFNGIALADRSRRVAAQRTAMGKRTDPLDAAMALLEALRPRFDQCYRSYFMIDDFPENAARFPVSFEACVARGRRQG